MLLLALMQANAGCPCTNSNAGLDTGAAGLPAEWGDRCAAWFDGDCTAHTCGTRVAPWTCDKIWPEVDTGTWCCDAWCYIDPDNCDDGSRFYPTFQKMAPGSKNLFYSMDACKSTTQNLTYTQATCPWQTGPSTFTPDFQVEVAFRDFTESHPDMKEFGGDGEKGCVSSTLGADGKPQLVMDAFDYPKCSHYTSKASFDQWYSKDTPSIVKRLKFEMDPTSGNHVFDSQQFFPLEGLGCADVDDRQSNNFYFTTEMQIFFKYNGGEVFDFRGDDDVWVFIDKKLVIDLGGVHPPQSAQVALDNLGLVVGKNYDLHLFHAERQCCGSSFRASTSLRSDQGVCPNQCFVGEERGYCNLDTGKCECFDGWMGADCGTSVVAETEAETGLCNTADEQKQSKCHVCGETGKAGLNGPSLESSAGVVKIAAIVLCIALLGAVQTGCCSL